VSNEYKKFVSSKMDTTAVLDADPTKVMVWAEYDESNPVTAERGTTTTLL
jgi:hypothetical protein